MGGLVGVALSYLVVVDGGARRRCRDAWTYTPSTALTVLTTVVGATVGLTGFVVTVSVLVVQMATGTFSARYMRLWYRDGILKAVLAVLIGTFMFSYTLLRRVETPETVPNLGVTACGFFLGAGLVLFLVFLDRVRAPAPAGRGGGARREGGPESLRRRRARSRRRRGGKADDDEIRALAERTAALTARSDRPGAIQAIDEQGLVAWAREHDCVLVLPHAIGVFVSQRGDARRRCTAR